MAGGKGCVSIFETSDPAISLNDQQRFPVVIIGCRGIGFLFYPLLFGRKKLDNIKLTKAIKRKYASSQGWCNVEIGQGQVAPMESDSGAGNKNSLFGVDDYCWAIDFVMEWD